MSNGELEIHNNTEAHRYEIERDGGIAILTYTHRGNQITFLHTEVPPALEGHGIGNKLAHTALEDARVHHLSVIPACPFVASYIRRHPEYLSLLPEAEKTRLAD